MYINSSFTMLNEVKICIELHETARCCYKNVIWQNATAMCNNNTDYAAAADSGRVRRFVDRWSSCHPLKRIYEERTINCITHPVHH